MAYPAHLWWLLLLPVFGLVFWWAYRQRWALFRAWLPSVIAQRDVLLTYALRGVAVVFLLLALPGFYVPSKNVPPTAMSQQIYFMLDVSRSMEVADVSPTRLYAAKRLIKRTADHFSGEQLGLIIFTNQAYVQVPLTRDSSAFETMLQIARPEGFADKGTNYRAPLRLLARQFASIHNNPTHRTARVGVLISDGEDFGGHYRSAISKLEQLGVSVIPVGIGTKSGGTVPLKTKELRNRKAKPVSAYEPTALRQLGEYFGQEVLENAHEPAVATQLTERIQSVRAQSAAADAPGELHFYPYFLVIALGALGISLFFLPQQQS